jgi:poly(beta-D-mannuronate) lyase
MKKTSTHSLLKNYHYISSFLLLMLTVVCILPAMAATITVSSLSALQTAINSANPGDVIILTNGVYTTTADITISKQGTASQPITIESQSILGAEIKGSNGFAVNSPAKYIVIRGFKFTHASSQATIASGTSFIRWTQCLFQTTGDGEYLQINGNDHEIDHNTFQHKNSLGKFITVRGTGSQIAQRLWIHHNYFLNQDPQSGNGNETIQFGLSGYSLSNTNSIFEYNLFEECEGENELLSVKASKLTVRFNTIRNCPAQLTLRHGNFCEVYGNYFVNTPGIRIFGDDHKIYSNHFESCNPAINMGNGDGEVADGDALTVHDRPDRNFVVYNTLVNNTTNYTQSNRTNGLGSTWSTFANNIIQGGGVAASISGPYSNATWSNNIIYQTGGAGSMPSGSYTNTNPLLARDATGSFHLQNGSPAINAGTGSYSWANKDMDGQGRTGTFDIGADEVSAAAVTAQLLTPSMVGPNAVDPPAPSCLPVSASSDDGNVPANVLDNDLNTRWSASGDGQWIQFCLGDTVAVTGVQIAFYNGNARASLFDVQVSNNGSSWTNAATGLQSSGTSTALETFSFAQVQTKYVRILGHGNTVNLWNSYTEVKIQTGTGGGGTFTLIPEADAYVRDGTNAAITHGTTDPTLLITKLSPSGQLNNARESYLRFNLASVSGTVSSATLRVYGKVDLTTVPSVPVGVYAVANTTWSESALTWNNKPASSTGLDTSTVTNTAYAYITWDVTSYVQAELAASRSKVSFAMKSLTAHDPRVFWNSKEFGSNPPELVIEAGENLASKTKQPVLLQQASPAMQTAILAYPNPFRASSRITFSIQHSGNTELSVFDIQGRRVALLVNGYLSAGEHRTQFSPPAGAKGIYLLRLVNGGKAIIQRIVQE